MTASNAQARFQQLIRELFQFDCADLDFGIYRIMNYKRDVIEGFITKDLPRRVEEELEKGSLSLQNRAVEELDAARKRVLDALGDDALDAEGSLAEKYRETRAGTAYLAAQAKAQSARGCEALESGVYNHLYTFFSRYWQEGDFISKRRYSKKERYAIPYNGEEVYLYWANHDQYYVKTGEHFTDYRWKGLGGVTVHFKLKAADVEQNNVKSEKRFFLPRLDEIDFDTQAQTITVFFEFRPLTDQEAIRYGRKDQQESIISEIVREIPSRLSIKTAADVLAALTSERHKIGKGQSVTYLEYHLRQYTRRNTSDFFIHKDLKGFLSRELDFYLKNEVLNLEAMERAGQDLAPGWFQLLRVMKSIGLRIVEFLAQIEEFQKMLWEKKKFVTETFYCITVNSIPEKFYPEIAACEAQWDEWKTLFRIHEIPKELLSGDTITPEGRLAFLRAYPMLVLDTRHFAPDFTDRLLASFDNLDEMVDGLLLHSENWQALNLLLEKHRGRVQCVYTDPPYNTGNDEFLYRDAYQHSSWLAMMENRLRAAGTLLVPSGLLFMHIDEREQPRLDLLMRHVFGTGSSLGPFIWMARVGKAVTERVLQIKHEYVLCAQVSDNAKLNLEEREVSGRLEDERGRYNREQLRQWGGQHDRREDRPTMYFAIPTSFGVEVYPKRPDGSDGCWRASREQVGKMLVAGDLDFVKDEKTGEITVYRKVREGTVTVSAPSNILDDCGTSATATTETKALFHDKVFDTTKPVGVAQRCISLVAENTNGVICDYFAGSGTTGHAVINLNREDGGRRRFILVEMADYFDTVLLPRIKKVTFSPEWKKGKPRRMATTEESKRSPRIIKVIRLESYEDALDNIVLEAADGQHAMKFNDYLLQYMLRWESRQCETLLNVEKLNKPFDYVLQIYRDGETRVHKVDLPETFNYLIGLDVERRMTIPDGARRYLVYKGVTREGQRVSVIWRENEGWGQVDYEQDRDFVFSNRLADGADFIFVNGDSLIPGAQSLEVVFKQRMFASVEG